ncbi:aldehyde dehydrogenase family protein [uncultured Friedmanniella sp.]|uniref:aldehyde dehydrogenase family protein n=1 Tax=uncultured Friedmanniella sp. TaxID=335381 RepID=UPI0035CA4D1D
MTAMSERFMLCHAEQVLVGGRWRPSATTERIEVRNPADDQVIASVSAGAMEDVDAAVAAARAAFDGWSRTSRQDRLEVLERISAAYERRADDLAEVLSLEVGAPTRLAHGPQVGAGRGHLASAITYLRDYPFEVDRDGTLIVREPIGVTGLITPWNWPLHQILCKVAPALAAGCTMVLKPSEVAPLNAVVFAEVMQEAEVPAGVFNLLQGYGATVGAALAAHPDVDMISFTGSTRAGVLVAEAAAPSVKRVTQELGGKSPNILLDDVDLAAVIPAAVAGCFMNSGQSCNAPTRLLVARAQLDEAARLAATAARSFVTGDPSSEKTDLGPVVSEAQYLRVQSLIKAGIEAGAQIVEGGLGRPDGFREGWFVRPTVFTGVTNDMAVAQQEIFGPVLTILPYDTEEEAIRIANDTEYGLAAYVSSSDPDRARRVGLRLRAGQVTLNQSDGDPTAPFGGYKKSGNGREQGWIAMEDFLETKAVIGYGTA